MDRGDPTKSKGFVNFPVGSQRFRHTGEGGMFVRLVALPVSTSDFMVCDGGSFQSLAEQILVGDDVTTLPSAPEKPKPEKAGWASRVFGFLGRSRSDAQALEEYRQRVKDIGERLPRLYYPGRVKVYDIPPEKKLLSVDHYGVLLLGSTGWTGYDDTFGSYWHCTYKDLTEDGRLIYDTMMLLYRDTATLVLQTWLDR